MLWSDEFDSNDKDDPNVDVWSYDVGGGGWGNQELQVYDSSNNVRLENGNLVIRVEQNEQGTFTSGRIQTLNKLEFQYARIEARIKIPNPSNGLWPCLWMLGADFNEVGWPLSGSMTLMQMGSAEALSNGQGASQVGSALHWEQNGGPAMDANSIDTGTDLSADYHTYIMDWTPESITTYVDGTLILSKDISSDECSSCDEFHKPYFFIANIAVGGSYMNIFDASDVTATLPAEMWIDYLRIYDNGSTQVTGTALTNPPSTAPPTDSPTVLPTTEAPVQMTMSPTTAEATPAPSSPPSTSIPAAPESTTASPTSTTADEATTSPSLSSTELTDPTDGEPPTVAPTSDQPIQNAKASGIVMVLTDVQPLDDKAQAIWTEVTAVHLANEVMNSIGSALVKVDVSLISQNPPYTENASRFLLRRLQQQQEVVFDATYAIQSPKEVQVEPFVTGAFVSNYKKALYLEKLKQMGGPAYFQNASYVSVDPTFTVSSAKGVDAGNDGNNATNIGLIVGSATAGLVVLIMCLALYARRRKNRSSRAAQTPRSSNTHSTWHRKSGKNVAVDTSAYGTIEEESLYTSHPKHKVAPNDNASSSLASSYPPDDDESRSALSSTLSSDYNYRDAFKNISKSVVSGTQDSNTTSQESHTVCQEFTVKAPKGKLGLVLEASHGGVPTVREIKPTSPLHGQVQVGDRLHSVDGRDVTMVMSETISRIIASKQDCETRIFVFARPQRKQ